MRLEEVGMLRLRSENRFTILTAPLSMTRESKMCCFSMLAGGCFRGGAQEEL
jgi:hypothetical protein